MSKREEICAAILAALETVPGVALVERNRTTPVPERQRPALVMFDGSEDVQSFAARRPGAPALMQMRTEIWGYVRAPDPDLGTRLNELLAATQAAVFLDPTLLQLCRPNGGVYPSNLVFGIEQGAQGEAAFGMTIETEYVFDPQNP